MNIDVPWGSRCLGCVVLDISGQAPDAFHILYCCLMLVMNGVVYDIVQALFVNISACQADTKPIYSYSDKANKHYVQRGMSMCLLLHVHHKDKIHLQFNSKTATSF